MQNINKRIIKARKLLKFTQQEAATKSNVEQGALSKIENGKLSVPLRYMHFLHKNGIDMNWLISGQGSLTQPTENGDNPRLTSGYIAELKNGITSNIEDFEKKITALG